VQTVEHPTPAEELAAVPELVGRPRKVWRSLRSVPAPLISVIAILLAVGLIVAITLSVYPATSPPRTRPAPTAVAVVKPAGGAPVLTVLPVGLASSGCLDPRSPADGLVLCPGDLSPKWLYDGGLGQAQARPTPRCDNSVSATPTAWVDTDNRLTHVHEQVRQYPTAVRVRSLVDRVASNTASLCSNLAADLAVKVTAVPIVLPQGADAAYAWSVPGDGRTWTMVLLVVDRAVVRLDVTLVGAAPGAPPATLVQQAATAAVARYRAAANVGQSAS
jgi:hypothetical protein